MIFIAFSLGQLAYGQLDISAELLREMLEFQFLGLFCRKAIILLGRNFRGVDCGLHAAQSDPHLLIATFGIARKVDGENLRTLLIRKSQQRLYLVEFVDIFALVEEDFAVGIVDDGLFDDR